MMPPRPPLKPRAEIREGVPSFSDANIPYYTPFQPKHRVVYHDVPAREPRGPSEEDLRRAEQDQTLEAVFGSGAPAARQAIESLKGEQGQKALGIAALALGTLLIRSL